MHLFFVTCAVTPTTERSAFSSAQRLEQIERSIKSVRDQVAESFIVILETGSATPAEADRLASAVNLYVNVSVQSLAKSLGEAAMINAFLSSEWFQQNHARFESFSKLSGRYWLLPSFSIDSHPADKYVIRRGVAWDGATAVTTRYYRIPSARIGDFVQKMATIVSQYCYLFGQTDIEHVFVMLNVFPPELSISDQPIGVAGLLTGDGSYVED